MTIITNWILVFQLLTTTGHNAMSAVSPFESAKACNAHAEQLFSDWNIMSDPELNHYHVVDSVIHYLEFGEGNWVAAWSCVPDIPYDKTK